MFIFIRFLALAPLWSAAGLVPLPEPRWISVDAADAFIASLAASAPTLVSRPERIGASVEGRPLSVFCVGAACSTPSRAPALLLTALVHGREPLGSLVNARFVASLLSRALDNGDAAAAALLATRRIVTVPNMNPDAYAYNFAHLATGQVMARKNRRDTCGGGGYADVGVDLNRNFDFEWRIDDTGSSPASCAEDFRGGAPESEPESVALAALVAAGARAALSAGVPPSPFAFGQPPAARTDGGEPSETAAGLAANVAVALNWHSFGRFINVPWAVRAIARPPQATYAALLALAARIAAAGGDAGGGHFGFGHPYDGGLYTCNGEASDWMLRAAGVLAYSPELGPEFEREPFEQGMWPRNDELGALVAEGVRMAETAAWSAGALVVATAAALAPDDTAPAACAHAMLGSRCVGLRVTLTVANVGARNPSGPVSIGVFPDAVTHPGVMSSPAPVCWGVVDPRAPKTCYPSWADAARSPPDACLAPNFAEALPWGEASSGARRASSADVAASPLVPLAALDIAATAPLAVSQPPRADAAEEAHSRDRARARADLSLNSDYFEAIAVGSGAGTAQARRASARAAESADTALPSDIAPGAAALTLGAHSFPPFSAYGEGVSLRVRLPASTSGACASAAADGTIALVVTADAELCSIFALSCDGALTLRHRGLAGCMPCTAYRVAAARADANSTVPPASASASAPPSATPLAAFIDDSLNSRVAFANFYGYASAAVGAALVAAAILWRARAMRGEGLSALSRSRVTARGVFVRVPETDTEGAAREEEGSPSAGTRGGQVV